MSILRCKVYIVIVAKSRKDDNDENTDAHALA